jgi:hypothetical protein
VRKPDHLEPGRLPWRVWLARRSAGVAAAVLGAASLVVAAVLRDGALGNADVVITLPGLITTAVVAAISLVRREPARDLVAVAIALALAGVVVGWLTALAIVIAAVAVALAILHAVM